MAAYTLFAGPFFSVRDALGNALVGAKLTVFQAGTTTPEPVYHNPNLSSAWAQPIVTNAAGQSSGPIYVSPTPSLKLVVVDADDVPVAGYPCDNWTPAAIVTA